ncbi:aspartic peptidase domain-containing protein [Mycena sp. CBHHK59/15]|nr:aspartic peptidase domain-containing protein [Mycena sp. CBHHK59/15]
MSAKGLGKSKAWVGRLLARDADDAGGAAGVVLPLQYISDGPYDISYTLPVLVGSGSSVQNLSLQVDTGSSDMWFASSSCSSSVCSQAPLYNPASAIPTDDELHINYLVGNVSGPIYWDTVTIGGYSIDNQALAGATEITSEPLSSVFSGVLGLALPANSLIAQIIPPTTSDAPDGAVWMSNLFSITPASSAPAARFLSVALARPGSDTIPSVLGVGAHPAALVPDPARVQYDTLYGESSVGPLFWKAAVQAITVYNNGTRLPVQIGRGVSGVFPSAVLDTGVPVILTTKAVADGIYGAISVQAGSDGIYYLPCTTPLNMTITLDERHEIPLHPLDLTTPPPSSSSHPSTCIGLIQTSADAELRNPMSGIGDMILGVPFLRNTYTVLAYDVPFANGTFPVADTNSPSATTVRPRLGLLGLTNPDVALDEFHRVRVLNQPLSSASAAEADTGGSHKQSVGIDVLIGLGGFVGLCVLLFGLRWLLVRRSLRRAGADDVDVDRDGAKRKLALELGGYPRGPRPSLHTVSTDRTQVSERGFPAYKDVPPPPPPPVQEAYDVDPDLLPSSPPALASPRDHLLASPREPSPNPGPEYPPERPRGHGRVLSVSLPLLPGDGEAEESMAGVGTARQSAAFSLPRGRPTSALISPHPRPLSGSPPEPEL